MKKNVLGIFAALFVFVVLLPMRVYATDTGAADVYAILYNDGTLVFQNGDTADPERTATNTYEVDLNAVYTGYSSSYAPWYNERESVLVVDFKDNVAPASTSYWFENCSQLERIDNIQNLDTSNVTTMRHMFYYCSGLTALDVSSFNTANVTDMYAMFADCSGLTALDLSGFDTANVTNMSDMFGACSALTTLDVSHFDTANVTNMSDMFYRCSRLTTLDVSHFNTANVTSMSCMFGSCSGLTALDVSNFNTANVTRMREMFTNCSELTALDVSHFDTANVTDMASMFDTCNGLTVLDVSYFDTTNVTDMSSMFFGCRGLTTLDVSHFNTANVADMKDMFFGCSGLTELDVSRFNTANVTDMYGIFYGCSGLTALDVSRFDTANVTNMGSMFYGCSGLTALDLSNFNTANVTSMWLMFSGCSNLRTIYTSDRFITASVTDSEDMFYDCTALVGGNGTTFDSSHTDKEYARIDTPDAPGYFTDISAMPAYAITAAAPGTNGQLSVALTNPDAATLAVAYFDTNLKFVSADVRDVSANAGTVTSSIPANATTFCVMLLDNAWRPLCEPRRAAAR